VPGWATAVIGAAAVITALGILVQKVIRPGARVISEAEDLLPIFREILVLVRDLPQLFKVTKDMAEQFKNDSGSSLRDAIDGLTTEMADSRRYAESLRGDLELDRRLAQRDREDFRQEFKSSLLRLDRLAVKVDSNAATGLRIESGADLDRVRDQGVADDLRDAHERADATGGQPPGAASDAAAFSARPKDNE